MPGRRILQVTMLAFIDLEERVPTDHPLRTIKALADQTLAELSPAFDAMYAEAGRPSLAPERLQKASLLIAPYSVRGEPAFCEELDYNLVFRWFLDKDMLESSFDPTVFTKNHERLLKHKAGQQLSDEVVGQAHERRLLSDEHFTVDGTLIEAAASLKSFRWRDEEVFGWMKTVGGFRRTRSRGVDRIGLAGYLVATAYNLVRLRANQSQFRLQGSLGPQPVTLPSACRPDSCAARRCRCRDRSVRSRRSRLICSPRSSTRGPSGRPWPATPSGATPGAGPRCA